jgi:hypothetical protein
MRVANVHGRLAVMDKDRALHVETASRGRFRFAADPQGAYERQDDLGEFAAGAVTPRRRRSTRANSRPLSPRHDRYSQSA